MSRNIESANELLFDLIKIKFDQIKISNDISLFNKKRWVYGDSLDKDWLINCKIIENHEITNDIRYGFMEYNNEEFYFVTGLNRAQNLPSGLEEEPLNPGVFLAIASELELSILSSVSLMQIENEILYQHVDSYKYIGHNLSDLAPFFPNIFILKVTPEYPGELPRTQQFFAMLLSCNPQYLYLKFEKKTLDSVLNLSLTNSNILSYDNIIHALLSSNYKYTFLDLYRCIEQLYQIVHIESAYVNLRLDQMDLISRTQFLETIDLHLSWKPQERSTLEKIFSMTPEMDKKEIFSYYHLIKKNKDANVSSKLYDLRCNIVHLKTSQKSIMHNNEEWEKIISGICSLLVYWYNKFSAFV